MTRTRSAHADRRCQELDRGLEAHTEKSFSRVHALTSAYTLTCLVRGSVSLRREFAFQACSFNHSDISPPLESTTCERCRTIIAHVVSRPPETRSRVNSASCGDRRRTWTAICVRPQPPPARCGISSRLRARCYEPTATIARTSHGPSGDGASSRTRRASTRQIRPRPPRWRMERLA